MNRRASAYNEHAVLGVLRGYARAEGDCGNFAVYRAERDFFMRERVSCALDFLAVGSEVSKRLPLGRFFRRESYGFALFVLRTVRGCGNHNVFVGLDRCVAVGHAVKGGDVNRLALAAHNAVYEVRAEASRREQLAAYAVCVVVTVVVFVRVGVYGDLSPLSLDCGRVVAPPCARLDAVGLRVYVEVNFFEVGKVLIADFDRRPYGKFVAAYFRYS